MAPNDDDVLFSNAAGGGHDIRVQVLLTADEFIFLRDFSKSRGISASSFFRQVLNDERRRVAQESLSANADKSETSQDAQDVHRLAKLLTKLLKES